MQLVRCIVPFVLAILVGCGGGGGDDGDDGDDGIPVADADPLTPDADPNAPDADPNAPDAAPGTWETLISSSWTLQPGTERYWCATRTLTEDIYAMAMRPVAPPGTHHTVIAMGSPQGSDNPGYSCGPEFGAFWASGTGMDPLYLPPGVGLLAPAGMQLRISLHLFNAGDTVMTGTSGLQIQRMDPADVVHTASVNYHGPLGISIPSNNQPHTQMQTQSIGNRTIVAIFPHMHQLGTHFRARLVGGPTPITLWDAPYNFDNQQFTAVTPPVSSAGTQLETQCTWVNNTGSTVFWGDSSNAEMCFSILMSYPTP